MLSKQQTIKVTCCGETKRISAPASYSELLTTTLAQFGMEAQTAQNSGYKFYFLDEDRELITVTCQDDFDDNSDYLEVSQDATKVVPALIYSNNGSDAGSQLQSKQSAMNESSQFSLASGQSVMMQNLQKSLAMKVEKKLEGHRAELKIQQSELEKLVQHTVEKEVALYCKQHLPRMILEQLQQMKIGKEESSQPQIQVVQQAPVKSNENLLVDAVQPKPIQENLKPIIEEVKKQKEYVGSVRFVKDESLDVTDQISGGMPFIKVYSLLNDGEAAWPMGVKLAQVLKLGQPNLEVVDKSGSEDKSSVMPGETCQFTISCTAPKKEGICCVELCLVTETGIRFGDSFQMAIVVPKLVEDIEQEESLKLANRDKSLNLGLVLDESQTKDKEVEKEQAAAFDVVQQVNPYAQMIPKADQIISQTPRQKYVARVVKDAITDKKMVDDLDTLFEMGFTEYDINLALLKKYGNCAMAAEHICAHGTDGVIN